MTVFGKGLYLNIALNCKVVLTCAYFQRGPEDEQETVLVVPAVWQNVVAVAVKFWAEVVLGLASLVAAVCMPAVLPALAVLNKAYSVPARAAPAAMSP